MSSSFKTSKSNRPRRGGHEVGFGPDILGTATMGERGQVVIPSTARRLLDLKTGDKLLVMVRGGTLCMLKAELVRGLINQLTRQLGKFTR